MLLGAIFRNRFLDNGQRDYRQADTDVGDGRQWTTGITPVPGPEVRCTIRTHNFSLHGVPRKENG